MISFLLLTISAQLMVVIKTIDVFVEHTGVGDYPGMNMKTCGLLNLKDRPVSKIVMGAEAKEGEYPWMVSLHYFGKEFVEWKARSGQQTFLCGGTLINGYWVLTNRHCVQGLDDRNMWVYLGSVKRDGYHQRVNVDRYYFHGFLDLAIIRLMSEVIPVERDNYYLINGLCLPKYFSYNPLHEDAIVAGFGFYVDLVESEVLRKTNLLIDPFCECLSRNASIFQICGTQHITDNLLCYGDSGSPVIQMYGNRAVMVGLVEGGLSARGKDYHLCDPGIRFYIRISFIIDWLKQFIETNPPMRESAKQKDKSFCFKTNFNLDLTFAMILISFLFSF